MGIFFSRLFQSLFGSKEVRSYYFLLSHVPCLSASSFNTCINPLCQITFLSIQVRILILGLDNAGKTTILYRLQSDSDASGDGEAGGGIQTIPTVRTTLFQITFNSFILNHIPPQYNRDVTPQNQSIYRLLLLHLGDFRLALMWKYCSIKT